MDKQKRLEEELERCERKLKQLQMDFAETRAGSRYGSEYLEMQCKVYRGMINSIKQEILKIKKSANN